MERYAKNFKAMSEAIPLLEEILGIYQHAINIQQAQKPTQKQIHETRDRMVKVSKSAQKIVEKLERKNAEIIQNPTEEKIEKAGEEIAKKKKEEKKTEAPEEEKKEEEKKAEEEKKTAVVEAGKEMEKAAAKQQKHLVGGKMKGSKHQQRVALAK